MCLNNGGLLAVDPITGTQVSMGLAFAAGVLSLASPCVLALVPAYLAYMTGVSSRPGQDDAASQGGRPARWVTLHALFFIAGFTLIFIALGASASLIGRALITNQALIGKIAGVLVAGFGLHTMGLLHIPWLDRQKRWTYKGGTGQPHQSFLIGMAFAAGWTPCVGPILGGILAIASVHATLWDGVRLLFAYAVGMGLPFLLMAATIGKSTALLDALKRRHRVIEVTSGLLLIVIGVMLYTDSFSLLARYVNFYNIL